MTRQARRRRWQAGRRAELLAMLWLRLKGYRILARNWRAAGGEVDILALRGDVLVAVEVKRRETGERLDEALEALARGQQRRIAKAAVAFLGTNRSRAAGVAGPAGMPQLRFDLIVVNGIRLRHLTDAWRIDM